MKIGIIGGNMRTDEVYGDLPIKSTEKFTESSPIKPSSPYSVSKVVFDLDDGEEMVQAWLS